MRREGLTDPTRASSTEPAPHLRVLAGGRAASAKAGLSGHASSPALLEAARVYLAEAQCLVAKSGRPSVNAAVGGGSAPTPLADAHQQLIDLSGIEGGDYMFILIEQRAGIRIDRRFRMSDYPDRTANSVWAQPLSRYHFAGQRRRRL